MQVDQIVRSYDTRILSQADAESQLTQVMRSLVGMAANPPVDLFDAIAAVTGGLARVRGSALGGQGGATASTSDVSARLQRLIDKYGVETRTPREDLTTALEIVQDRLATIKAENAARIEEDAKFRKVVEDLTKALDTAFPASSNAGKPDAKRTTKPTSSTSRLSPGTSGAAAPRSTTESSRRSPAGTGTTPRGRNR